MACECKSLLPLSSSSLLHTPPPRPIHPSVLSSDVGSPSNSVPDRCLFSFHVSFLLPAPPLLFHKRRAHAWRRCFCSFALSRHADRANRTRPLQPPFPPSAPGSTLKLTRRNPTQGRHFTANQQEKCSISCRPSRPAETETE